MKARHLPFKQADASRALRAAVAAGLKPSGITIAADGSITVNFEISGDPVAANTFDQIMKGAA